MAVISATCSFSSCRNGQSNSSESGNIAVLPRQLSMIIYLTQETHRYSCQSGVQGHASTVRVYARLVAYSTQGQPVASVGGWWNSRSLSLRTWVQL